MRHPVIVGGRTRCARTFGIRSATPMFQAPLLCPHAVIIPSDMDKYVRTSREGRQLMQEPTPLVQSLSIDEAFLDLGRTARLLGLSLRPNRLFSLVRVWTPPLA
jgi:DNA polymerase IV